MNRRRRTSGIGYLAIAFATFAHAEPPNYPAHNDLSFYLTEDGSRHAIHTADDWRLRRADILAGMQEVMGALPRPNQAVALDIQVLEEHEEDGYIRRKIAYYTDNTKSRNRAWLLIPTSKAAAGLSEDSASNPRQKRCAVLCLHQTFVDGKDSPVGIAGRPTLHYAKELAQRGYVTISPDYPSFGELKEYDFESDDYISGSMKAIYDNIRAIDVLQSLPEVDGNRIGCIGHSLGGHNTLFTTVFDDRIKAAVTSCGFTSFPKYKGGNLTGWTSHRYMPLIKTKYNLSSDRVPFDFPEVLAAIAPRAVFIVAPIRDDNFDISGVKDCLAAAGPIFELLGHPENLQAVHPDAPHEFPDAERMQAYAFLDDTLKNP
jgi:hypothetical protein